MSKSKYFVAGALALAGMLAAGTASANRGADVQWSVTIGAPVYAPAEPVYAYPGPVYAQPAPVYAQPYPSYRHDAYPRPYREGRLYREPAHWDRDGDGIPNRRDHLYNPRWDVDGDGIPNRYDRDRDGTSNWHDRHDGRSWRR